MRPLLARFTPVVAPGLTGNNLPLQLFTAAIKNEAKVAGGSSIQEMAVTQVCTCVERRAAAEVRDERKKVGSDGQRVYFICQTSVNLKGD